VHHWGDRARHTPVRDGARFTGPHAAQMRRRRSLTRAPSRRNLRTDRDALDCDDSGGESAAGAASPKCRFSARMETLTTAQSRLDADHEVSCVQHKTLSQRCGLGTDRTPGSDGYRR
jgi:hypothetical protein